VYARLGADNDQDVRLNAYRAGLFSPISATENTSDQNLP
jgi:hypothetical protein